MLLSAHTSVHESDSVLSPAINELDPLLPAIRTRSINSNFGASGAGAAYQPGRNLDSLLLSSKKTARKQHFSTFDAKLDINLENEKPFYIPGDIIKGHATLIPRTTFTYDDLTICMEGRVVSKIYITPVTQQTAHHLLLKMLDDTIPESSFPENKIALAGETYKLPFSFVVPEKLLEPMCKEYNLFHRRLPPSFGCASRCGFEFVNGSRNSTNDLLENSETLNATSSGSTTGKNSEENEDDTDSCPVGTCITYYIKARIYSKNKSDRSTPLALLDQSLELNILPSYPVPSPYIFHSNLDTAKYFLTTGNEEIPKDSLGSVIDPKTGRLCYYKIFDWLAGEKFAPPNQLMSMMKVTVTPPDPMLYSPIVKTINNSSTSLNPQVDTPEDNYKFPLKFIYTPKSLPNGDPQTPPLITSLITRLKVHTINATTPINSYKNSKEDILADKNRDEVRATGYKRLLSRLNPDLIFNGNSSSTNISYKEDIWDQWVPLYEQESGNTKYERIINIEIPKTTTNLVPNFHSCLLSRFYELEISITLMSQSQQSSSNHKRTNVFKRKLKLKSSKSSKSDHGGHTRSQSDSNKPKIKSKSFFPNILQSNNTYSYYLEFPLYILLKSQGISSPYASTEYELLNSGALAESPDYEEIIHDDNNVDEIVVSDTLLRRCHENARDYRVNSVLLEDGIDSNDLGDLQEEEENDNGNGNGNGNGNDSGNRSSIGMLKHREEF